MEKSGAGKSRRDEMGDSGAAGDESEKPTRSQTREQRKRQVMLMVEKPACLVDGNSGLKDRNSWIARVWKTMPGRMLVVGDSPECGNEPGYLRKSESVG